MWLTGMFIWWFNLVNFTEKLMFALLTKKSIRFWKVTWGTYSPASYTAAGKKDQISLVKWSKIVIFPISMTCTTVFFSLMTPALLKSSSVLLTVMAISRLDITIVTMNRKRRKTTWVVPLLPFPSTCGPELGTEYHGLSSWAPKVHHWWSYEWSTSDMVIWSWYFDLWSVKKRSSPTLTWSHKNMSSNSNSPLIMTRILMVDVMGFSKDWRSIQ